MAEDGQKGLHIQEIHIKINKPVKSLNNFQINILMLRAVATENSGNGSSLIILETQCKLQS